MPIFEGMHPGNPLKKTIQMFKTVLIPIDHSREAIEVGNKAITLAKNQKSSAILLSVIQNDECLMDENNAVNELLDQIRSQMIQAEIPCDVIKREGKPAFVICDVAHEFNVDLIVMGARGINLEGDTEHTATRVIELAPCPVLVMP